MGALAISVLGLLLALGLILAGRRYFLKAGNELRCRHCAYLLRGIDSDRCPECGHPTRDAVRGQFSRRWHLLILGAVIAIPSVYGISRTWYRPFYQPAWFRMAPTRLLLWQERFPSCTYFCWKELRDRTVRGQLTPAQQSVLFQAAVHRSKSLARKRMEKRDINECLLRLAATGKLSRRQADQACDASVLFFDTAGLKYDPGIPALHLRVYYSIVAGLAQRHRLWTNVWVSGQVDPQTIASHKFRIRHNLHFHIGMIMFTGDEIKISLAPGQHTLTVTHHFDFYSGTDGDFAHSHGFGTCTRTATTHFVVPVAKKPATRPF